MSIPRQREFFYFVTNIAWRRASRFSFKAAVGTVLIATILCLSVSSLSEAQPNPETTATINFVAMKSEAALVELLHFINQKDIERAAEYLRGNGLVITKGTHITILDSGCDGRCVKFSIKGRQGVYWAMAADVKEQ